MMSEENTFGAWVRTSRRRLDLTQEELAEQVGCSPETLRKLEGNTRRPSKQLAERLALSLAIPPQEHLYFVAFARAGAHDLLAKEHSKSDANLFPFTRHIDWGEAPDVSAFYGREAELALLYRWLLEEQCRLVTLLGMGGIGKTALAARLAQAIQDRYEYILWYSLRNAPSLNELLEECLVFFSDPQLQDRTASTGTASVDRQMRRLLDHLRRHRCLIVLDNAEAILAERERAGHYRAGYENYGYFLQTVGEVHHQSCVLVTSREKPHEIATLATETSPVRVLTLASLPAKDGRALLMDRGLFGPDESWSALTQRYSGNPLALQVVAETIRELIGGDIAAFLREETMIFGEIRDLLAAQFARLSALEQEVMLWLAVEREPVRIEELHAELVQPVDKAALWEALHSLRRRSLVEQTEAGLTLQNVVMEYVTGYLVEQAIQEITTATPRLLAHHALVKAEAKEYVRENQRRMLLVPVAERLLAAFAKGALEDRLWHISSMLRQSQRRQPGYMGGNLLNLLVYLQSNLRGQDFSQLAIWQADLRDVKLHGVNFSHCDLARSLFTMPLGLIQCMALSPDDAYLAVATQDRDIQIWGVADGQPLFACAGHTGQIRSLCYSPDGSLLASASFDGTVRLWEMAPHKSGRCLAILRGHNAPVWHAGFSPDGTLLATAGEDATVRLWDLTTLDLRLPDNFQDNDGCLQVLRGHLEMVYALSFSPDGKLLASRDSGEIILWRLTSTEDATEDATVDAAVAPSVVHKIAVTRCVMTLCFSPDGKTIASPDPEETLCLWDVESGERLHALQGHSEGICAVCYSPDGRLLATCSDDQTIRIWDTGSTVGAGQCVRVLQGHTRTVMDICFSADGSTLISGSLDQTVRLWDVRSGRCLRILPGYTNLTKAICFHPDGKLLARASWSRRECLQIWDITNHDGWPSPHTLPGHTGVVSSVSFSPDGALLASGGDDQIVRLWDVKSDVEALESGRQECVVLAGHTGPVLSLCFSPDSKILASGAEDREIRIWAAGSQGGQCLHRLRGHAYAVTALSFSPDGLLLASASNDWSVRLWNIESTQQGGECLYTFEGHGNMVRSISFSPDGALIASGSLDQTVRVWDVQSRRLSMMLAGHTGMVSSVCFHPAGKLLASASQDGTIRIWGVESGRCLHAIRRRTGGATSVCFSSDGKMLAVGGQDSDIDLWSVDSPLPANPFEVMQCRQILRSDRPYEGMNITGVSGVPPAQIAALKALGAVQA